MSIEELFQRFNDYADTSKQYLDSMLSIISEGRVPTPKNVSELEESIKNLQMTYSSVYQAALSQLPADEMPDDDAPAGEFVEAVKTSQSLAYKRQLEEAEICLRKFIAVRSLVEEYARALSQFQDQAASLLKQFSSGAELSSSDLEDATAGPRVFLSALECENKDSSEGIALCDQVDEFYPRRIGKGIVADKYFIDYTALDDTDNESAQNIADVSSVSPVLPQAPESPEISAADTFTPNVEEPDSAPLVPTEPDSTESCDTVNSDSQSEFVRGLQSHDFFMDPKVFGEAIVETSPNETRKISASIFSNELRKFGNDAVIKKLLQQLMDVNILTPQRLCELNNMPEHLADSSVAYMFQRGFLRKFTVPLGSFYAVSPRLSKALEYKDSYKWTSRKAVHRNDWGESIENNACSITSRLAALDLHISSIKRFTQSHILRYASQLDIMTDAFLLKYYSTPNNSKCEVMLGAFWEDAAECSTFLQSAHKMVSPDHPITAMVIASLDLAHAKVLADALLAELDDTPDSASIYLYSLSEKTYFSYPDLTPVAEVTDHPQDDTPLVSESDICETVTQAPPPVSESDVCETIPETSLSVSDTGTCDTIPEDNTIPAGEPNGCTAAPAASVQDDTAIAAPAKDISTESEPQHEVPACASDGQTVESAPSAFPSTGPETQSSSPAREKAPRSTALPDYSLDEIKHNTYRMLCAQRFYAATTYLKSLCPSSDAVRTLHTQLCYALNDPMGHCSYTSSNAFELIARHDYFEDCTVIATALRMFFSNQVRYDYTIKSFYESIKNSELLSKYPALSTILYTLMNFKDTYKKGMDAYADYRVKDLTQLNQAIKSIQKEAENFYDNFIAGHKKENCSQKRFLQTKMLMFSPNSDFGVYLKAIADGEDEPSLKDLITDFLQEHFYNDDAVISEDTFDESKLWSYIIFHWNEAGKQMVFQKLHDDLKSRLRNNITNQTVKAVQLLAKWYNLVEHRENYTDDDGTDAYKKVKKGLLENIDEVISLIRADLTSDDCEKSAGLSVLLHTLTYLSDCLTGIFDEKSRKYFYLPFLLTSDVTLAEDLTPDLDVHRSVLMALRPEQRILNHVQTLDATSTDYTHRLHEILDERGDDYGSAQQIAAYLSDVHPEYDLSDVLSQITEGIPFAKENAEISKTDFIGELELAQSYGQIDNSIEDKKEMILQIINDWWEWADETANYGFFTIVMQKYLHDIKECAKSRENDLLEQLEKIKSASVPGLSMETRTTRIKRIQEMIHDQNYTVAEDLLARFSVIEDENTAPIEENFLEKFLNHYNEYYAPVAAHQVPFLSLVSSRTRNKEERGARRLAENWLPGGGLLGENRLKHLLDCYGFKIDSLQTKGSIGKYEHYFVKTKSTENGKRIHYTHPIAAFGSGAAKDGFRVVCVNGTYNADGLIDIMKKIGDSQHTLILLDFALALPERRRLARKSKSMLGNKLFAVVDRTVMMFLVRNFNENQINRMLISLITPFGYYQPYVWDSANVMPPEIFMGRKKELEQIKSATGVNIVYGGRQLGKSALLRKAKEEIDQDENNDRAVYIDIKGRNYLEAAQKIGHELYDQNILEEDIDTTDWDELSRAIKRRLQSSTAPAIPYLLLLLDEADTFIDSCEAVNFKPLDALKEIQNIDSGKFKFVIAGLHNVVRFKREAALSNNSVLTHLQSMTVTPFSTAEARELLEVPLHYLGLRFPSQKQSLITLILATTNYFPGLIQLYCAKLLEAMRSENYAGYNEVETPIYEISEAHIKQVLSDSTFTQQISEKFEITLNLDGDDYYKLIALIMAYLYHNNGYNSGYSASDIKTVSEQLGIEKISALSESKLTAFMEELKELNVLRNTDETHYLFTRVSFFQMLGTSADVDDALEKYMTEG